ncbi:MAG: protein kinase, partial [Myxococcales bacterium]|nr:protein kinase [Myxococcales bacterium]
MGTFLSDRYELVRHVADGPIASLHEGRLRGSAGFSRPVAIRQLEPRYAKDPRFVGAWAAAATEVAERPSPHLEEVLDLVVDRDRVYVVTEWIDGLSLAGFLGTYEHPPWTLVTRVLVGLLDGLHRLHTIDPPLVHRGVSASAVRISIDGAVKLTRTGVAGGLAAIGEGRTESEAAGLMHVAPELLDGHGATPATDVFGLGALALEALAAGPPFVGGDLDEPRDLASVRKDVPPLLVSLVERALRPEPGDRFESADEMARALERLLHAEPTPIDASSLARAVRGARDKASKAAEAPGPAALAASLSRMKSSPDARPPTQEALPPKEPKKRPVGLPEQRTLHVDDADFIALQSDPPPAAEPEPE